MMTDALLLDQELRLVLGRRRLAPPMPGEARVRVQFAGVCGSDLHVLRTGAWVTYWPATLGHEVVGVVEECPGAEIAPGTTVVVDSRLPCRKCTGCRQSPHLCGQMAWLGEASPGGFARHLVVGARSLVPCPDHLESAVAVLAEPLAVAMHAVSRLSRPPRDALILGYGPIGALVHQELVRRWPGIPTFVSEPSAERRGLALAFGAQPAWPPPGPGQGQSAGGGQGTGDGPDQPTPGGDGQPQGNGGPGPGAFSLVVDAAGHGQSLTAACANASNGGTVLVVALSSQPVPVLAGELVERALTLTGSVGFDHELADAVAVLAADPDRYRPLVTEALLLEEAVERLGALASSPAASPAAGKVVIRPWLE